MGITITGLIIAAAVTILDKSLDTLTSQNKWAKRLWLSLVLGGLIVSVCGALEEDKTGKARDEAIGLLTSTVSARPDDTPSLKRIEDDLNELLAHAGISPNKGPAAIVAAAPQFFVEIAADRSRTNLQPYLNNLQRRFGSGTGAAILDPKPGSSLFRLVWGEHLDKDAAEQRAKAADALRLPPAGQNAQVVQESR